MIRTKFLHIRVAFLVSRFHPRFELLVDILVSVKATGAIFKVMYGVTVGIEDSREARIITEFFFKISTPINNYVRTYLAFIMSPLCALLVPVRVY